MMSGRKSNSLGGFRMTTNDVALILKATASVLRTNAYLELVLILEDYLKNSEVTEDVLCED